MSGLLREARGGVLFHRFVQSEVVPLHAQGFRPENVYQGFRVYHDDLERRKEFGSLEEELKSEATDPYDTHPALNERLAYAESLSDAANAEHDETPAISILKHPERTEEALSLHLSAMIGGQEKAFSPVSWAEVSARVHAPRLNRDAAGAAAKVVAGLGGAARAHEAAQTLVEAMARRSAHDIAVMLEPRVAELDADVAPRVAQSVLVRTLGLLVGQAWVDAGGEWISPLGRPFEVVCGKETFSPFALAQEAVESKEKLAGLTSMLGSPEASFQSHSI